VRAEIRVLGERKAAQRFHDMAVAAETNGGFFRAAARVLLRATSQRFAEQPWLPLDRDTIRQKARSNSDLRVLRASGALERALTVWGAPGQTLEYDNDELRFGIDQQGQVFYGRFHQHGEGVPQRTILTVTQDIRTRLRTAYRNHIMGRV
jgi:hypothetical protein